MLFRRAPVTYTTGVGGDVAQLGERRTRIAEVVGSNPIVSTRNSSMDVRLVKLAVSRAVSEDRTEWYPADRNCDHEG